MSNDYELTRIINALLTHSTLCCNVSLSLSSLSLSLTLSEINYLFALTCGRIYRPLETWNQVLYNIIH